MVQSLCEVTWEKGKANKFYLGSLYFFLFTSQTQVCKEFLQNIEIDVKWKHLQTDPNNDKYTT